jgi:hypothetical protein
MKLLVEDDFEGMGAAALERATPRTRATLRAWLAIPHEPDAARVAELLELSEDDLLGSLARFCDARVLAGDTHENIFGMIEDARLFLASCNYTLDTSALAERFTPKARAEVAPNATRQELMQRLMDDPYTATVARRLFGIEGVIPTQAFLRDLVALDLRAEDEPRVARIVATLGTVADAHREIIEPLRRGLARH